MALLVTFILSILLTFSCGQCQEQPAIDEASCVCGINREVLERLEAIVKATPVSVCSLPLTPTPPPPASTLVGQDLLIDQPADDGANQKPLIAQLQELTQQVEAQAQHESQHQVGGSISSEINVGIDNQHEEPAEAHSRPPPTAAPDANSGVQLATGASGDNKGNAEDSDKSDFIAKLAAEIHRLEAQILSIIPQGSMNSLTSAQAGGASSGTTDLTVASNTDRQPSIVAQLLTQIGGSTSGHGNLEVGVSEGQRKPQQSNDISTEHKGESSAVSGANGSGGFGFTGQVAVSAGTTAGGSGFLVGLPTPSKPEILIKPNQSDKVDAQVMENAVESTVPGVVSNIFSNIQSLALQTEQHKQPPESNQDKPGQLTSIDGNSVSVQGESTAQITAEGEKLFIMWIEHQLGNLHLTASMANYIRKSALNLFRRIVKQYVERISKIGGSLEDNARRATQMALNNTQHLITFLLKNYLNISGGLMQIIGEQVSRIGKQLDSTGDTIAHMSLNPLTIVTKVMDSLPNPSDYSNYFREFSKQLLGTNDPPISATPDIGAGQKEPSTQGLITKTMGALGKTLSSWLG